jgi:hypothetical protein
MYLRNILWFERSPGAVREMWVIHAKSRQRPASLSDEDGRRLPVIRSLL